MGKVSKIYDIGEICCDESVSDDENEPQGYLTSLQAQLITCCTAVHCLCLKMLTCAHSKAIKEVLRVFSRGG